MNISKSSFVLLFYEVPARDGNFGIWSSKARKAMKNKSKILKKAEQQIVRLFEQANEEETLVVNRSSMHPKQVVNNCLKKLS